MKEDIKEDHFRVREIIDAEREFLQKQFGVEKRADGLVVVTRGFWESDPREEEYLNVKCLLERYRLVEESVVEVAGGIIVLAQHVGIMTAYDDSMFNQVGLLVLMQGTGQRLMVNRVISPKPSSITYGPRGPSTIQMANLL